MKSILRTIALSTILLSTSSLAAQCISDDCGDIFADWAILNTSIAVCEGSTFEVENQTLFPNIDFYVWDWGNGERDTVYEVSNYFYTYEFEDDFACSVNRDLIVYNISLEIYRTCEAGQSCHTQIAPVAVRLRPRANFNAPEAVCVGEPTVLTNETCGAGDYLWIFPDGSTSTDINPEHTFESTGEQEVILIVTNECGSDTVSTTVNVIDQPVAIGGINEEQSLYNCGSTVISFVNNSHDASYFYWQFPGQSGYSFLNGTNAQSPNPMVQFTNPGVYNVNLIAGNACRESQWQTTIEVIGSPTVTLAPIPTVCEATTIALMDYAQLNGAYESSHWTITGPEQIEVPQTDNPTVTFTTPGVYTIQLEVSHADCPSVSGTSSFTIQTPQEIELTAPSAEAFCTGSAPLNLETSLPGGIWSGPGIHPQTGIFDPAVAGSGSHTIRYIANHRSCLEDASIVLEILESEPIVMANSIVTCIDEAPVQLTATPVGGSWSGNGISDSGSGLFDPGLAGLGTTPISYSLVNADNCVLHATLQADVRTLPTIEVSDRYQICPNQDDVLLTELFNPTLSPGGGTLSWSVNGVNMDGTFNPNGEEGTYTINMAYTVNGCTTSTEVNLDVIAPQTPTIAPNQVFCQLETSAQLTASPAGGTWSGPGLIDANNGIIDPTVLTTGEHTYTYTFAAGSACASRVETQVAIWNEEAVEAGSSLTYCPGIQEVQLPEGFPAGGIWSGPGVLDPITGTIDLSTLDPAHSYTYEYSLMPRNGSCNLSDRLQVAFHPTPELEPTLPEVACIDAVVNLLIQPEDHVSYSWQFPNGDTYDGPAVQYAFQEAGAANVTLLATTDNGCSAEVSTNLQIVTPPQADMFVNIPQGCEPLEVSFANNSQGDIDSYFWDFSNGITSTEVVPDPQIFSTPGPINATYTVSLVASNTCGEDRVTQEIVVYPSEIHAFFTASTTTGCAPLDIELRSHSPATNSQVTWDFGDGYTGTGPEITHTFEAAGTYTISQLINNGCDEDIMTINIEVLPIPEAGFSHPNYVCAGAPIEFTPNNEAIAAISWDFGDGNTSSALQASHQYENPGTYTVSMTIDNGGCPATATSEVEVRARPQLSIATPPQQGCPPFDVCLRTATEEVLNYEWNFGDGNVTNNLNPCHTFTDSGLYAVTVRGVDNYGCASIQDTVGVLVYEKPVAEIINPDDVVCGYPQEVTFGSASTGASAHHWTFSNGIESALTAPNVTFTEAGTYLVELEVENTFGCKDFINSELKVKPRPIADFAPFYEGDCVPQDVVFDNFSNNADSYLWFFGNGEQSTKSRPVQFYDEPGEYDITLIVGKEEVCFDTLTLSQAVELKSSPIAAFIWESASPDYEGLIQFTNGSVDAQSYFWDFGDGATSTDIDPLHDYQINGSWLVSLLATADNGCQDMAVVEISPELIYGLHFPNAFSPETGQGDVRVFKPAGLGLAAWELEIFSPWGERVFSSSELNGDQPGVAWNGVHKGKVLPQGAYAYKASVEFQNGLHKIYTGSVTLLR